MQTVCGCARTHVTQAKNHVKRQLSGQKVLLGGGGAGADASGMGGGGAGGGAPAGAGRVVKGELKSDHLKGEANHSLRQVSLSLSLSALRQVSV